MFPMKSSELRPMKIPAAPLKQRAGWIGIYFLRNWDTDQKFWAGLLGEGRLRGR